MDFRVKLFKQCKARGADEEVPTFPMLVQMGLSGGSPPF